MNNRFRYLCLICCVSCLLPTGCLRLPVKRSTTPVVVSSPLAQQLQELPETVVPVLVKQHGEDMVTVQVVLRGGPTTASPLPGLEALTLEAMLHCGSGGVAPAQWRQQLEQYGITLSTAVGPDYALLHLNCPERYWVRGWELMLEALFFPDFDKEAYQAFRDNYAAALQSRQQDPVFKAYQAGLTALFGKDHLYAIWPEGSYAAIAAMPLDSVVNCHGRLVSQRRLQLVVTGDVNPELVHSRVEEVFTDLKPGIRWPQPAELAWEEQRVVIDETVPKSLCTVTAFFPAPLPKATDAADYLLALEALSMRMQEDLCHQRYLACETFAEWVPWQVPFARVGFQSMHTYAAVKALIALLRKVRLEGFTEQEIATAHMHYLRQLYAQVQTSHGMASWLTAHYARGSLERILAMQDRLDLVTPESALKALNKYSSRIVWHYYGPPKQVNAKAFKMD
ncbi:MAG: insulinase family protein [Bacteroidetes bacterium]|nr:insulinase family protein [Bacteroidota bacterium]